MTSPGITYHGKFYLDAIGLTFAKPFSSGEWHYEVSEIKEDGTQRVLLESDTMVGLTSGLRKNGLLGKTGTITARCAGNPAEYKGTRQYGA